MAAAHRAASRMPGPTIREYWHAVRANRWLGFVRIHEHFEKKEPLLRAKPSILMSYRLQWAMAREAICLAIQAAVEKLDEAELVTE